MLTLHDIAKMLDHSLSSPRWTPKRCARACSSPKNTNTTSVCVKPCDLKLAGEVLAGTDVRLSTVISFPHGSNRAAVKVFEANLAMDDGAVELDMVLNIGLLISGNDSYVLEDIKAVVDAAHARGVLVKVILKNVYLTDEQKERVRRLCAEAGADFTKTSTGYAPSGATIDDLKLMRANTPAHMQVKAVRGVRTLAKVLDCRAAGCTRCGGDRHRCHHARSGTMLCRKRHAVTA